MSEIAKAIDKFLNENMSEKLKNSGFKKKRRNWYRKYNNSIETVRVEASTWNHGNEGQFEVTFSLYVPEIAKVFGREMENEEPKGFECDIAYNVLALVPDAQNLKWIVKTDESNEQAAHELSTAVEFFGLPWFETIRN